MKKALKGKIMISKEFFAGEITKLQEEFKYAGFSRRKSELIYMAVKNLEPKQLARVIDKIIGNFKHAPVLKDFQELVREFNATKEKTSCDKCSSGIVSQYLKTTGECYAFACSCPSGLHYPAFQSLQGINMNLFTSYAPECIDPTSKRDPYANLKLKLKQERDAKDDA